MTLPEDLDIEMALIYFHAYMYGPLRGKVRLYSARGVTPRVAMSEDWELFASILVRDQGVRTPSGLDLEKYEVKSAKYGGSFEYQYHRNSWQRKLAADRDAGHLFISHQNLLRLVEVRYCAGSYLREFFDAWEAERPYTEEGQQRFRRSVSFGWVQENAALLLRIEDGEVTADATE
ncbi:MAG: hypothetical protein OXT64_02065 [Gammaproteobacteria bacterium]|nr:hypothetical protein [Gammaproteobacteria bacterium]